MVLVDHDVDAELVAHFPFVHEPAVELGGEYGVEVPVGQDIAQRLVPGIPRGIVWLFGELPDFH